MSAIFSPEAIRWDNYKDLQSAVKRIGIKGPAHKIGSYRYSDEGAGVAALLVEKLSGKKLETFFRERIFETIEYEAFIF